MQIRMQTSLKTEGKLMQNAKANLRLPKLQNAIAKIIGKIGITMSNTQELWK